MEKPTVVISDLHGHIQKLVSVLRYYDNDYQYVFNGDIIDRGPDTKSTLEVIRSMGEAAIILKGNHEWVLQAALTDVDTDRRGVWRDDVWLGPSPKRSHESRMLESYGIVTDRDNEHAAQTLKQRMQDTGHLELLENSKLYYETDEMLVIHAGVESGRLWQRQKEYLDEVAESASKHIFTDEPRHLFDPKLCRNPESPDDIWNKTLITGHVHLRTTVKDRVWHAGHRIKPTHIRLASHLQGGDPLFVYETDTHEITEF